MPHLKNIDFTNEAEVTAYVLEITAKEKPLRHENYDITVAQAHDMSVHIKGILPVDLIETARPHEEAKALEYRLSTYEPVTKADSKKVINALARIQNAPFSVKWEEPSGKVGEETLEKYVTKDYPFFGSVNNWIFKTMLKQDLADPNSVVAFKPMEQVKEGEFFKPFGFWYGSAKVWDFKIDTYYTLLTDEKTHIIEGNDGIPVPKGIVLNIYTLNQVIRVFQVGKIEDNEFKWEVMFNHGFNKTPVFRLKGEYIEDTMPFLYESFMAGVLPYWNKVIRQESDKDASFVSHIYPERVEMEIECTNVECVSGRISSTNRDGGISSRICGTCHGTTWMLGRSPLTQTVIRRKSKLDDDDIEFPGVQYLVKETDTVKTLKQEISDNRRLGFATLNMEFLADVPLNQSGKAKEVDRVELNTYVEMVSNNLFDIKEMAIVNINLWRYSIVLDENELEDQLPEVGRPTSFDMITTQMITQEISAAKEANLSQDVIAALETEFVGKRFVNSPEQMDFFTSIKDLDPIAGTTLEEKLFALNAKSVTMNDVILSTHLANFIKQLISEGKFFELNREQRLIELKKLTDAKKNQIDQINRNGITQPVPPEA